MNGKLKPALLGGAIFGIASGLPIIRWLNCACCALVAGGGFLAAHLYQKESPKPIQYGDGAVLGLLTGVIGGLIETVVSLPFSLLSFAVFDSSELQDLLRGMDLPPEVNEWVGMLTAQEMMVGSTLVITMIWSLVIWLIFATIGAIIGVAVFQKPAVPSPGPPPPGPPTTPQPPMSIE